MNEITKEAMAARAARTVVKGAVYLDEQRDGWWREDHEHPINLDTLDIESGYSCVTAQLSGISSWGAGRTELGMDMATYTRLGFRTTDNDQDMYPYLTDAWKRLISDRRGAEAGS